MSVKLDKRYKRVLGKCSCIICNKKFIVGDIIDIAKTRRHDIVCVHTACWKDEQDLFKWQAENRKAM